MKSLTCLLSFFIISLFVADTAAQTPKPTATPKGQVQPAEDDDVVRITTNLIQVDVVVTDKNGKQVTNLKPEDFEIVENGKSQKITNFSYINIEAQTQTAQQTANNNSAKKTTLPAPAVALQPEQVRRTLTLVVDDYCLSVSSVHFTKKALKKFVDEKVLEGDLVAIIRTSGGIGVLQQFTSNKQQLYAAIDNVRFNPIAYTQCGRGKALEAVDVEAQRLSETPGSPNGDNIGEKDIDAEAAADREARFTEGTLSSLDYVIRGMSELPGRKAAILFSEGFSLVSPDGKEINTNIVRALERVVDRANRAAVVVYTVDPSGLVPAGITAEDKVTDPYAVQRILSGRRTAIINTQHGLALLSRQTGGFDIKNTNDVNTGIQKVLDDQKGYYLIGYQPDASIFDATKSRFNKLMVKVKYSGLNVRYRSGFFGVKDKDPEVVNAKLTPQQQVLKALISPFNVNGVGLRLTSIFTNEEAAGSYIRSLMHISAKDLTFTKDANGDYKTVVDVVALTFGDNGRLIEQVGKAYTLSVAEKDYENTLKNGLVYQLNVPIKKPGAYQLRVAVRDEKSEKIGGANQFIEIPDLKKERLTLSGLVVGGYEAQAKTTNVKFQEQAISEADPLAQASVRRFREGNILQYGYFIYNAKIDRQTNQPQLTTQMRLFREGKLMFTGKEIAFDSNGQTDLKRINASGALRLGGLESGEYILQIIVKDKLAKEKYQTTSRWIEFEVFE